MSGLYNDLIQVDKDTGTVTINGTLVADEIENSDETAYLTGADAVAITATAAEIDTLADVVAGTVTAEKALVVDANKDLASLRNLTLTGTLTYGSLSKLNLATASKTAGTTQTQAGATAITSAITLGTTGNADDGYLLPAIVAGDVYIIVNLSANAAKVYANGTETLNGTAGNAGSTALAASKTTIIVGTGAGTAVTATLE